MWQAVGLLPAVPGESRPGPWTEIISSPLKRCRSFAEELGAMTETPVELDENWQEIDYGAWDGLPLSQWREIAAPQFRAFRQDLAALHPPDGEPFVDFRDRVVQAWRRVSARPTGSRVLLVTHGGVMRVILPTVLGMPLNQTGVLEIPFACLSRILVSAGGHCRLLGHNIALDPR